MKVAIYARYSSENQRDASIADQFRICREFAANDPRIRYYRHPANLGQSLAKDDNEDGAYYIVSDA